MEAQKTVEIMDNIEKSIWGYPLKKRKGPMTRTDKLNSKLADNSGLHDREKITIHEVRRVADVLFWLTGTPHSAFIYEVLAYVRKCYAGGMADYLNWAPRLHIMSTILSDAAHAATRTGLTSYDPANPPVEIVYSREIQAVRAAYHPLKSSEIQAINAKAYGQLLALEQAWPDWLVYKAALAWRGGGQIAVRHYVEILGRIRAMVGAAATTGEQLTAEFAQLDKAAEIINRISGEEV